MNYKHKIGNVYSTNCGVNAEIIATEGFGKQRVMIRWLDEHAHECVVKTNHLAEGKVWNPYAKLIQGVGYCGVGKYSASTHPKHHNHWGSMITRVYNEANLEQSPTYIGCAVKDVWLNFQNFAEWCTNQSAFGLVNYQLDKDVLCPGNKIYGPEFCRFVPRYVNTILSASAGIRGEYPLGVHKIKAANPYVAKIKTMGCKSKHLGVYPSPSSAHQAWQLEKANQIELTVIKYAKEVGFDSEIADALLSRAWNLRLDTANKVETLTL